jgi:cell division protein FtsQ
MAEKRKISVRKILQVITTIVVSTCCIIALVSASDIEDSRTVASVAVHIQNDKKYHFIEQNQIMDLAINNRNIDIAHTPLFKLDIHGMERVIMSDPWVASAQVFIDNERVLHMFVTQRIPVARVFQQNSVSYYLDTTLSVMPLSGSNIYYTTVVTNVPELKNDSSGNALKKEIVSLVRTIQADSFWNAQISQVIVDSARSFELMPLLGDQRILFGNTDMAREKLNNLFVFYKNVLNRIGWDKYETLDLRFKGQVVAAPSLPYKGPVDKAIDKMNWINSIVETEAKNDEQDSTRLAETKGSRAQARQVKEPGKLVVKPVVAAKLAARPEPIKAEAKPAAKKDTKKTEKTKHEADDHKTKSKPGHSDKEKEVKKTEAKDKPVAAHKTDEKRTVEKKPTDKAGTTAGGNKDNIKKDTKKDKPAVKKAEEKNGKEKVVANNGSKEKSTSKEKNVKKEGPKYVYPEKKEN